MGGGCGDGVAASVSMSDEQRIGIPAKLGEKGVKAEHVPRLVEVAVADICHQTNPKPVKAADFERIFRQAL